MKAKINDNGKVVWFGSGSGEQWVELPDDVPDDGDPETSLHYDRDTGEWYEK